MTKIKKFIIIHLAVIGVFVITFLSFLIVYLVRKNNDNDEWKAQKYSAHSSIGEFSVNYSDFTSFTRETEYYSILLDDQKVRVSRRKGEDYNSAHFVCNDNKYYIIIIFNGKKTTGFLYSDSDDGIPIFIEKLNFVFAK